MALDDAKVAYKDGFCRRGFSSELSVFDDVEVAVKTASSIPSPWFSMMRRSRRKPLLQKDGFCRRGFSPELSVFDDARVTAEAALITSNRWIFDGAEGRG